MTIRLFSSFILVRATADEIKNPPHFFSSFTNFNSNQFLRWPKTDSL